MPLVQPDAMLAGDRATSLHTHRHDLLRRALDPGELFGIAPVEEKVRMEVAVPRVKHVGDGQVMAGADLGDPPEDAGKLAPWDRRVLNQEIARYLAHGPESLLAALPKRQPLLCRVGRSDLPGPRLPAAGHRPFDIGRKARFDPVELDHQRRLRVGRETRRVHTRLDRSDRGSVDDLQSRRHQALGHDLGHGTAGISQSVEDRQ